MIHVLNFNGDIIDYIDQSDGAITRAEHEINIKDKLETFDFTVLSTRAEHFKERNRIIIDDEDGSYREFIISKVEEDLDGYAEVQSNASYLEDIKTGKHLAPYELKKKTVNEALDYVLADTRWEKAPDSEWGGTRSTSWTSFNDKLSILKMLETTYDMRLDFYIELDTNKVANRYVRLKKVNPLFNGEEIAYGHNMLGLKRTVDFSNLATALICLGPENTETGERLILTVKDDDAQAQFGLPNRYIWDVYEPETQKEELTEARLRTLGITELNKRKEAVVSYAIQSTQLNVKAGDMIRVKNEDFTPELYVDAEVIKLKRDKLTKKSDYGFGVITEYSRDEIYERFNRMLNALRERLNKTQSNVDTIITDIGDLDETFERVIIKSETPPDNPKEGDLWLRTGISEKKKIQRQIDEILRQIAELESQSESDKENLRNQLSAKKQELEDLKAQIRQNQSDRDAQIQSQINDKRSEISQLEDEIEDYIEEQKASIRSEIASLKTQRDNIQAQLDTKKAQLENELSDLRSELATVNSKIEGQLNSETQAWLAEKETLLNEKNTAYTNYQNKLDALEDALNEARNDLLGELETLKTNRNAQQDLKNDLDSLNQELQTVKSNLSSKRSEKTQLEQTIQNYISSEKQRINQLINEKQQQLDDELNRENSTSERERVEFNFDNFRAMGGQSLGPNGVIQKDMFSLQRLKETKLGKYEFELHTESGFEFELGTTKGLVKTIVSPETVIVTVKKQDEKLAFGHSLFINLSKIKNVMNLWYYPTSGPDQNLINQLEQEITNLQNELSNVKATPSQQQQLSNLNDQISTLENSKSNIEQSIDNNQFDAELLNHYKNEITRVENEISNLKVDLNDSELVNLKNTYESKKQAYDDHLEDEPTLDTDSPLYQDKVRLENEISEIEQQLNNGVDSQLKNELRSVKQQITELENQLNGTFRHEEKEYQISELETQISQLENHLGSTTPTEHEQNQLDALTTEINNLQTQLDNYGGTENEQTISYLRTQLAELESKLENASDKDGVSILYRYENGEWIKSSPTEAHEVGAVTKEEAWYSELVQTLEAVNISHSGYVNNVRELLDNKYLVDSYLRSSLNGLLNELDSKLIEASNRLDDMTSDTATLGELSSVQRNLVEYREILVELLKKLSEAKKVAEEYFRVLQNQYSDEKYNEALENLADVTGVEIRDGKLYAPESILTTVENARKQIESMKIGSGNLLDNSNFSINGFSSWYNNGNYELLKIDGKTVAKVNNNANIGIYQYPEIDEAVPHAFSFKARAVNGQSKVYIGYIGQGSGFSRDFNVTNEWKTFSFVINKPLDMNGNRYFHIFNTTTPSDGFYITDIMLVKGTTVRDWQPSTKDLLNSNKLYVDEKTGYLTNKIEDYHHEVQQLENGLIDYSKKSEVNAQFQQLENGTLYNIRNDITEQERKITDTIDLLSSKLSKTEYQADRDGLISRLNSAESEREQLSNRINDRVTLSEYRYNDNGVKTRLNTQETFTQQNGIEISNRVKYEQFNKSNKTLERFLTELNQSSTGLNFTIDSNGTIQGFNFNKDKFRFDSQMIEFNDGDVIIKDGVTTIKDAYIDKLFSKDAFIERLKATDIDFNRASARGSSSGNELLITSDLIEQKGRFNRTYRGKNYDYNVTSTLKGGYLRFWDETREVALNMSAFGISTFLDGDGGGAGALGSSGYIQWWDGQYSPTNSNGITVGSVNVVALKSDNNRVVLDAARSIALESKETNITLHTHSIYGISNFTFTKSSDFREGYLLYGGDHTKGLRFSFGNTPKVQVVDNDYSTGASTTIEAGYGEFNTVRRRDTNQYINIQHANILKVGSDSAGDRIEANGVYRRTYSGASNVHITGEGTLGRSTSARKYKLKIENQFSNAQDQLEHSKKILQIAPKTWFDKFEAETYAKELECGEKLSADEFKLQKHFGAIADEFHEIGMKELVQYDSNGEIEGLAYDRMAVHHNVLIKDLYTKDNDKEQRIQALERKLKLLKGA